MDFRSKKSAILGYQVNHQTPLGVIRRPKMTEQILLDHQKFQGLKERIKMIALKILWPLIRIKGIIIYHEKIKPMPKDKLGHWRGSGKSLKILRRL